MEYVKGGKPMYEREENMIRAGHQRTVNEILDSFNEAIKAKVPHFPIEWDGFEIRRFLSDYLTYHYALTYTEGWTAKRAREYSNIIKTTDLL